MRLMNFIHDLNSIDFIVRNLHLYSSMHIETTNSIINCYKAELKKVNRSYTCFIFNQFIFNEIFIEMYLVFTVILCMI